MMNKTVKYILCGICLLMLQSLKAADIDEIYKIKTNYKNTLVPDTEKKDSLLMDFVKVKPETEISDQVVVELHQRYPFNIEKMKAYLKNITKEGFWSDINYKDTKRSGWEPKQHTERILELSKLYYSKETSFYHSQAVKEVIHSALNFWFSTKLICPNWWYNQIGIPKTLGGAFILLEEQLSSDEKKSAIEVMEHAKFGMTGQNKVWLAGNVLIKALLQNDEQLVKAARDTIASEICTGRVEGIKDDWSFHQHGPQQQFGNYGLSFISGMSFFCKLFDGTSYQFDKQRMEILQSLVNEGYRWIIWNRYMDVSSLGRQLFHQSQIYKAYGLAFAAADLGMDGFPKKGNPLIGHKHFDCSDYTVHRSHDWMGTVKMSSNRVIGTELVNEDNLKGYYMGDGATYFYVRGDEYLDVFPFWDWRKIPGITSYDDTAPIPNANNKNSNNRTNLVGGLSYGNVGMAAMELNRNGLKAYKSWLFMDDFAVCLGSGIKSDSALQVTTSVDQRLKNGDLLFFKKGRWNKIIGEKVIKQNDKRFFHDNTGYIVLGKDSLVVEAEKRSGRWCDFMKMYKPQTVEGEVVSLFLKHGIRPQDASYQYIVIPACQKEQIANFEISKRVKVIRSDSIAQVLQIPTSKDEYWVAAYKGEEIKINGMKFVPQKPGIYYLVKTFDGLEIKVESVFKDK